ncbi:MAG TPA: PhoX family phosphatase [Candidatus Limnocylindrales bacterium]|nr:PhoX family phosphatase [Candidatus Limnocylindrales bacterium]
MTFVDTDDVSSNPSGNRPFQDVLTARVSRRAVMVGGTALAAAGFLGAAPAQANHKKPKLGFKGVSVSTADTVVVPEGYTATVLIPWGTPIHSGGPAWLKDGSNTAADQAKQIGFNHDGMAFFPRHGLLALNHEYTDAAMIYTDGDTVMTKEKVDKALAAHGVSIVKVAKVNGAWRLVDSRYNRRITGATPVTFSGPVGPDHPELAAKNPAMGTLNNCSSGATPWGTYVTCEENWNQYFGTEDTTWTPTAEQARYGIGRAGSRWHLVDQRFDVAKNPKELNRFGWGVEIDPARPDSKPVKRTALGRFKHEGMTFTEDRGRIVAYSGDDQVNDYIYKFVGNGPWRWHRVRGRSPLDHGTLYVAKFNDDGTGQWLPLVFGQGALTAANGWKDQADVLLRTRLAADAMGATPMDRPEWIAVHPRTEEVFVTLTNGNGGSGAANPRTPNPFGHIIKWRERGDTRFEWDIFVLAGDPQKDPSVSLDDSNMFGSPDGIGFDPEGRLWIQTDVSNSNQNRGNYDRIGNNQMLAADPETGEIRRFLVGPRGCEITGQTFTPDGRTMFINIQHPGEATTFFGTPTPANPRAVSNWPDFDPAGRPRPATLVIRKNDGGVIGS